MSERPKDLQYYLDNPDEMPTDPKEIEQLAQQHMQVAVEAGQEELTVDRFVSPEEAKDETKGATSGVEAEPAKTEEPAKAAAEAKPEPAKADVKEGILAADGKNIIPMAVLKNTRERLAEAERIVREQQAELDRMKTSTAPGATINPETEVLSEEDLSALEEDSPTLAKILRANQETIQKLSATVQSLSQQSEKQAAVEADAVKTEVQAAIDANPTLLEWQNAEDQTMWNEAAKFDQLLRQSSVWADKTFAERFDKVVELTQSALGVQSTQVAAQNEQPPSQAEIKAAAAAKLAAKSAKTMPVSLSQIPGGAPPAVDERDKVENMSASELGNTLLNLGSKEAIDAYLASL